MKLTAFGTNLIQLTRLGFVNCYLVRENDGFTLVDTTMPGGAKGVLSAAKAAGAPVRRIVLTHAHGDHVGSLDKLSEQLGRGVEVAISERDARFLEGDKSLDPKEPQSKLSGSYPKCSKRPERRLGPEDRVGSLEVVATPGHTPGHISLWDVRQGILIAGDAFSTLGGVSTASRINPRFPLVGLATWDRPTAQRSAEAVRILAPSLLATGHGPVIQNPQAAIDEAIASGARSLST